MDDKETLHRRARLRELVETCFGDKTAELIRFIAQRTGKSPNQGELSAIQKDNGGKSFGDKKARSLTEQIGLHREWFNFGLGVNTERSMWLESPTSSLENISQPLQSRIQSVPLISWVTAGELCGIQTESQQIEADEWIPVPGNHSPMSYALRVVGESMQPKYQDGWVIIVDPERCPQHGDDVIINTPDGKTTFKQLHMTEEGTHLLARNPHWPDRIIPIPDGSCICGVVVGAWVDTTR